MDILAHFKGNSKGYLLLLKVAILCLLICAIYSQLASRDLQHLWASLQYNWAHNARWPLFLVVLLTGFNLSLESLKWKFLLRGIHNLSFSRALKAVLTGITVGMFTPNRMGETAGRALLLPDGKRLIGLGVGFVSSHAQLVASFTIGWLGTLGFLYFSGHHRYLLELSLAGLPLSLALLYSFFQFPIFKQWIDRIPLAIIRKYSKAINPAFDFGIEKLSTALLISGGRHLVFSFQLLLFLLFFSGTEDVLLAFGLVLTAFFLQTLIPSVALLEFGIRGGIMLWLCQLAGINELGAIAATFALWVVNLLIPALIGTFYLWTIELKK